MEIVKLEHVSKIYGDGDHELKALDDVDLTLEKGKFIVILRPSGAGKSTLLNLLGGLDVPTNGKIVVDGKDIATLNNDELANYRASKVGFIFQFYNLIPTLTVLENVSLINEIAPDAIDAKASEYEMSLSISWLSFVISILITLGVSWLVSVVIANKNKKIDMVESLKCSE